MTAPKPDSITDREPDACEGTDATGETWFMHLYDGDEMPVGTKPLWLVSADDLAARDEAVRREVLAEAIARIESLAGDYANGGHEMTWRGARHCVESLIGEVPTDEWGWVRAEATPDADEGES